MSIDDGWPAEYFVVGNTYRWVASRIYGGGQSYVSMGSLLNVLRGEFLSMDGLHNILLPLAVAIDRHLVQSVVADDRRRWTRLTI